jgi:negative regulator of flagellin synthesis FlgM
MKINDVQRINGINPYKKTNETKLTQSDGKKQKMKDEVNISSEAKELQGSNGLSQQVRILKEAYTSGSYHVDAGKIADKIFPYIQ